MQNMAVVIVVPCYNEAARLQVAAFERFLDTTPADFIFVNDGSRDNTLEILKRVQAGRHDRVHILSLDSNRGKAEAVRRGMQQGLASGADYAGFWDADLATPLDAIPKLVCVLEQRPEIDMVFGSRVKLLGRNIERRPGRHYAGRIFATVVSSVLRIPVYDTQCGAKIFRAGPKTRAMFEEPFLSKWVFDVEFIARYILQSGSPEEAARHIYEYPLEAWEDVRGSRLKPADFLVAFGDVVRIYGKYMRRANSRAPR
jgi:glycosyltransferase involved in cell wall biosynthesis